MERLVIIVGRPNKSLTQTKYFFYVPLIGRFMPLVGVIRRPVESPLDPLGRFLVGRLPSGDSSGFRILNMFDMDILIIL